MYLGEPYVFYYFFSLSHFLIHPWGVKAEQSVDPELVMSHWSKKIKTGCTNSLELQDWRRPGSRRKRGGPSSSQFPLGAFHQFLNCRCAGSG